MSGLELPADSTYQFWKGQLARLGDEHPVEVLGATPATLERLVQEVPADRFRQAPAGKWSALQLLGHLADVEIAFAFRIRSILCDVRPRLMAFDQDRWVARQDAWRTQPGEQLAEFRGIRRANLTFWRELPDTELDRAGVHDEAGIDVSLDLLRRIQAGHDLVHLDQMRERLGLTD